MNARSGDESIVSRIEDVVRRYGDRPAVHGGGETLSYEALNALANRIARTMLATGFVAPGPVALFLGQGISVAAAALGATKAGGTWVQIHPRHPSDRNAFQLADSMATHVVTDRAFAERARDLVARAETAATVVVVENTTTVSAANLRVPLPAGAPVLIKYTSGSTGLPKGVCLPAQAVLASTDEHITAIGVQAGDRIASLTPLLSTVGHYGALLHGAAEYLYDVQQDGIEHLAAWLDHERITVLQSLPTVFRRLVQAVAPDRVFPSVRVVWLFGEAVTRTEYDGWRAHFPAGAILRASLGSTESLGLAAASFTRDMPGTDSVLPLRCYTANRTVRLVDSHGADVGPGEVGEIEVRSAILFSGYWRRPELTAAVLTVDPDDPSQRIFRTGDLGRHLPDGRFVHAGRVDRQVKVAGNRIEMAEIEHALRGIPGIRDAAVVARTQGSGIVRLVACCVPDGDPPSRRAVRDRLAAWLPSHMIPSAFMTVDALPALSGGKTDYTALTDLVGASGPDYAPPRHPIEETLVESWQRILATDGVGIHDDLFLDLGGDSLAAVQILSEVALLFGRELPLAVFHEAGTIAKLAERLLDTGWRPPADGRLVLHAGGRRPPLFAICGAYGHALRLLLIGRGLDAEQPFVGLQPPAMDWERAGCRTIDAMAAHYAETIRRFHPHGPYRLLGTSLGGLLAFETALVLQARGIPVDLLAMVDTSLPTCRGPEGVEAVARRDFVAGNPGVPMIADGMRVARQHQDALRTYVLERRFDGEILYFQCAGASDATSAARRSLWGCYASGGLRVVPVPGEHGDFHREPQRSAVIAGLRAALR